MNLRNISTGEIISIDPYDGKIPPTIESIIGKDRRTFSEPTKGVTGDRFKVLRAYSPENILDFVNFPFRWGFVRVK